MGQVNGMKVEDMTGIRTDTNFRCGGSKELVSGRRIAFAVGLALWVALGAGCAGDDFKRPSLYQRLGGKGGLTVIVSDWLARAAADARIARHFPEGVTDRIRPALVTQLCELSDGPCRYQGREMKSAHAALRLDGQAYDAMLEALGRALDQARIPAADSKALFERLAPLRKEIIT